MKPKVIWIDLPTKPCSWCNLGVQDKTSWPPTEAEVKKLNDWFETGYFPWYEEDKE